MSTMTGAGGRSKAAILGVSFLPKDSSNGVNVSAGPQSALQWERTQAWTAIGYVKIAAAPAAAGAEIIFTTCNQGQTAENDGVSQNYRGYELWVNDTGKLQVRIISTYATNYIGVTGSTVVTDGAQHLVAATYDGSSTVGGVKLYVDGNLETNTTEANTLSATIINNQAFWVGNQKGWPYTLGGQLKSFSLHNVVRNQAWVQAYTTAGASRDANTVLAYEFGEGSGRTVADVSGSGFNGFVGGATWLNSNVAGTSPYWIQGKFSADPGLSASASLAVTLSTAVTSGNMVVGAVTLAASPNTPTLTIADDKSNSYTVIGYDRTLAGTLTAYYYRANITNAPTTITATLSSGTGTYWRVIAEEFANVTTSSPLDANNIHYNSAANGTDAATSNSFTPTVNYDLIYSAATNFSGTTMTAGTGFTPLLSSKTTANEPIWTQYLIQPAAGAISGTFTTGGSTQTVVSGMALKAK